MTPARLPRVGGCGSERRPGRPSWSSSGAGPSSRLPDLAHRSTLLDWPRRPSLRSSMCARAGTVGPRREASARSWVFAKSPLSWQVPNHGNASGPTAGRHWPALRCWATTAPMTSARPPTSHGIGLRCWSHPLAVAVCQQVVPGPSRCTYATNSDRNPAPASKPSADRRADGFLAIAAAAMIAGTRARGPSETSPRPPVAPTTAQIQTTSRSWRVESGNLRPAGVAGSRNVGRSWSALSSRGEW